MKAILVDDEQSNLDNLRILLGKYCPQVDVCGAARDAREATRLLYEHRPDLVFLDIQMPGTNGFEWLQSLPGYQFGVIFVTAFDQYAIQALRLAAIDYLLKPISIEDLQIAVERAGQQFFQKEQNLLLQNLVRALNGNSKQTDAQITLPTTGEIRFVKTADVIRCESANNYTTFYLTDGEALVVCKPIYLYDGLLTPQGFIRCHQSHLVNRTFIKSWKKESGDSLLLTNGTEIPIARSKKDNLKNFLIR